VGRKLRWRIPKAKPISRLFREERVAKVILQFLKDTGVGKCSTVLPLSDRGLNRINCWGEKMMFFEIVIVL
jgi:hypothetical protein